MPNRKGYSKLHGMDTAQKTTLGQYDETDSFVDKLSLINRELLYVASRAKKSLVDNFIQWLG